MAQTQLTVTEAGQALPRISEPTPKREPFTYYLVVIENLPFSVTRLKRIAFNNFILLQDNSKPNIRKKLPFNSFLYILFLFMNYYSS